MNCGELIGDVAIYFVAVMSFVFAYLIGIKEQITLLHSYHIKRIKENDKRIFAKKIGVGQLVLGLGFLIMPTVRLLFKVHIGYIIGTIITLLGTVYIIAVIIRYNKGLF